MSGLGNWPALVLTAGLGTRLRPLSSVRAKAALPVAGRAIVVRILERLQQAGIRRVVLNLHHKPESVTAQVGDGAALGLEVRYSWEPVLLGSGGGPARALPLLAADRFFIVNGDTLAGADLAALAADHIASGALATMAVTPADLDKYSAVLADASGIVTGLAPAGATPSGAATPWHFVGIQAVSAAAFAGVNPGVPSASVGGLYPRLAAASPGAVRVFPATGEFFDIGTPADYLDTVRRIAAAEHRSLDRGIGCRIDPTARLDGTILWDNVTIGAGAELTDSIVADGVTIPAGSRYYRQAITEDAVTRF